MTPWPFIRRAAWLTLRDLVGGLVLGVGSGAAIHALTSPLAEGLKVTLAAAVALGLVVAAGRLWGRDLAGMAAAADPHRVGRFTGAIVGPAVIAVGGALSALEPSLVRQGASHGLPLHVVYTTVFTLAALLVAGAGGFALGLGMEGRRLGARLGIAAAPAGALGFLTLALLLNALGWQVGAPDAARRATMLVVSAVGAAGAALTAGGALGQALIRPVTFVAKS